jgi:hypothetical protein
MAYRTEIQGPALNGTGVGSFLEVRLGAMLVCGPGRRGRVTGTPAL